jgi:glycosyltransferase involved in cell wall biosynthesis
MSLTITVPTIGRHSLLLTLESIAVGGIRAEDEVIVIGDGAWPIARQIASDYSHRFALKYLETPRKSLWGHPQRNIGISLAKGTHLATIDDDDVYVPGGIDLIRAGIDQHPDKILLFKMRSCTPRHPWGTAWRSKDVVCGNVGSPMIVVPNIPAHLGRWGDHYAGDFDFISETIRKFPGGHASIVWREEFIVDVH